MSRDELIDKITDLKYYPDVYELYGKSEFELVNMLVALTAGRQV